MTTLHEQLERLADTATSGRAATGQHSAPDLWARGRRRQRRRRLGGFAAAVVVLVALAGLATTVLGPVRPEVATVPSGQENGLRLPDSFAAPSARLPGTDDEGLLGPLVGLVVAPRGDPWFTRPGYGVVGVSGDDGTYRFLDLPGGVVSPSMFWSDGPALSADGRHVAYWYLDDPAEADLDTGPGYDGVASYDTTTGEVTRLPMPSPLGFEAAPLVWAGDDLWVTRIVRDSVSGSTSTATGDGTLVWTPSTGSTVEVPAMSGLSSSTSTSAALGALVTSSSRELVRRTPRGDGLDVRRWSWSRPTAGPAVVSLDGSRVAVRAAGGGRAPLLVGDLPPRSRTVDLRATRMTSPGTVTGWRGDDVVIASRHDEQVDYLVVDPTTGSSEEISEADTLDDDGSSSSEQQPVIDVAADAWSAPVYAAPEPPTPLDPRIVVTLGGGLLVGALVTLIVWRRRVRP